MAMVAKGLKIKVKTNIPDRRPNEDQHVLSEIHRRPTCLIGDRHADLRQTCLIRDLLDTNMPDQRPIRDRRMFDQRPYIIQI